MALFISTARKMKRKRKYVSEERNRLIQKLLSEKKSGSAMAPGSPSFHVILSCYDHEHHDGLITVDVSADDDNSSTK